MEGDKENDWFEPPGVTAPPAGHLKQRLDDIFAEVTNNLPSIDLEFSDVSSDEEDVPIFHAPVGSVSPRRDAENDTDLGDITVSLEDEVEYADRLEHILSEIPVGPALTDTRCVGVTKEARKAKIGDTEKETDTLANNRGGNSMELEANRRSRRHSDCTTLNARVRRAHMRQSQENAKAIASQFMPAEPPNLTMNNIDLDALFNTTGGVSCASRSADCAYLEDALADNATRTIAEHGDGLSLIQRLAQISLSENERNQHNVDPQTGAIQRKTKCGTDLKERKTAENLHKAHNKLNCMGTNTQDLPNCSPVNAAPKVPEERDTIHIDLRGFENKKPTKPEGSDSVRRILQIYHDETSDDSSDDDDDAEMWHEQRKRIKDSLRTTGALPPEYRKQTPAKSRNVSTSATTRRLHPRVSDRPGPKASVSRVVSETETRERARTEEGEEGKEEGEECGSAWAVDTEVDSHEEETEAEREQERRREEARKVLERRQKEHQSRIRLGLQLDAMRPTVSNTGREASVEAAPTLFDTEVSYEPEIETLPPDLPADLECVLLTVPLSCNGELMAHKSGGGNTGIIDNRGSLSGSYTTLLSWLLSLVPGHSSHPRHPYECISGPPTPFHVIGLQQMYLDDQLCLFIAVTPKVDAAQDSAKLEEGKTKDESTAFQKDLAKFLSTNTLHTVCPWLEALFSPDIGPDQSAEPSVEQQSPSVYKPLLSNITTRPLSSFVQVTPDAASAVRVFGLPIGFFWQMIEGEDVVVVQDECDDSVDRNTQTTMSLIDREVYRDPRAMTGILHRVRQEGLDLVGIRLLFHRMDVAGMSRGATQVGSDPIDGRPVLAMAIRGRCARQIWLDAVGPADPVLARITDPDSLMALYGGQTREESLLYCPHSPTRATAELCRWFGGRVPASGVVNTGNSLHTKRSQKDSTDILGHRPPAVLTVALPSDVFVLLSPLVPGRCTGLLLATAQRRGYGLSGFRQLRLTRKKCTLLGMSGDQAGIFTGSDSSGTRRPGDTACESQLGRPCMVMQLRKENALHHVASLIESFTAEKLLHNMLTAVQANCSHPVKSSLLFHAVNFSEPVLNTLGGDFTQVPSVDLGSSPGYIAPKLYTNPELEEFVVVTFVGHEQLKTFGESLSRLQNMMPHDSSQLPTSAREAFELLGLKWQPRLTSHQARQLTPCEVGDKDWKSSVHTLTSEPAVVVLLRGINAFHRGHSFVASQPTGQGDTTGLHHKDLRCLVSATPDIAYQQAMVFFHRRELYADPSTRWLLPYLPPCYVTSQTSYVKSKRTPGQGSETELTSSSCLSEESIFDSMLRGPRPLCTLLLVKPDVVKQGLRKLLRRLAQEGFVVVTMRLQCLSEDLAMKVVPEEDRQDGELCRSHVSHMTSGPCLLLSVQRENAVKKLLDLLGPEDPRTATVKNCGYWRAIFGRDGVANGLYASRSYAAAVNDQKLFFPGGLCCKETPDLKMDMITCQPVDSMADMAARRKLHVVTIKDSAWHGQPKPGTSNMSTDAEASAMTGALGYLTETTCVLLTPALLQPPGGGKGRHFPYIDIIESLLKNRFELVGCRMLWLTKGQAEQCLHLYDAGSFSLVPQLTSGPSIVVALQRDNAIVLFDALLGSVYDKESLYFKYSSSMLRSKDAKQATNQLCFFFDELAPGAHAQIVAE